MPERLLPVICAAALLAGTPPAVARIAGALDLSRISSNLEAGS